MKHIKYLLLGLLLISITFGLPYLIAILASPQAVMILLMILMILIAGYGLGRVILDKDL